MNSPGQIEAARQELTRLGCYTGATDGSLDAAAQGGDPALSERAPAKPDERDRNLPDDFIADLKQQSTTVCPIVCPAGKIAEGRQCVDAGTSKAVVQRKDEGKQAKTAKLGIAKPEARPTPLPRATAQAPSGSHSTVTPGVGLLKRQAFALVLGERTFASISSRSQLKYR